MKDAKCHADIKGQLFFQVKPSNNQLGTMKPHQQCFEGNSHNSKTEADPPTQVTEIKRQC